MDNLPEIAKCFGTLPPKHATYLISLFGLASGGTGLSGIILYGLIEKAIMYFVYGNSSSKVDDTVKKLVLLTLGLTSILLLIANLLLFLGATTNSSGTLSAGVLVILAMCMFLMFEAIILPTSCFFYQSFCVIKKLSTTLMVLSGFFITLFLEIWLYFMIVANTFLQQL